ncbi:MAG: ATP-binding protein [Clostridiales bacterium]|nr:ATP-binding protein [Clostridiales bacterium]
MLDYEQLILDMESLVIFRDILADDAIASLLKLLDPDTTSAKEKIGLYSGFAHKLFQSTENLTEFIWKQILDNENFYALAKAKNQKVPLIMENALLNELEILQRLSYLKSNDIIRNIPYEGFLPHWTNSFIDFCAEYKKYIKHISTTGYGIYAKYLMFVFDGENIVPVKSPDPIKLSQLSGYKRSRKRVIDNTLALLDGRHHSNVLLYGDAGTGKSSTVKAVVNRYGDLGLRLIEIRKADLLKIPSLMEMLRDNPLKFIIFIDDLSFPQSSDDIGALKAILEGTVYKKAPNIAIYATSNRRHLVKESFSDRENDDVHRNETIEEQTSLSERFGMTVSFIRPNKDEYLNIVYGLARQYGLKNTENLELLAERYALERGGRSGRAARQLIEYLKSMEM